MAHGYYQGWESDADPLHVDCSISPECQQMRTFLDLDSPTDSLCSLPADGCAYVDCYGASFLLLSPAPSVVSTMHTANALSTAEIGDTETIASSVDPGDVKVSLRGQLSPSLSFASFPGSSSTITTCTSSSSSISSQNRHSILPGTRQHFLHRQRDSIDDDVNYVDEYHTGSPRHRYTNSMRLLDRYLFEQPPTSAPKPQSRSTNRSDSPVRSASKSWRSSSDERSASSDGLASSVPLSKDEFEALPVTIQRKVSDFSTVRVHGKRKTDVSGLEKLESDQ
ncbi:hypothetical protein QQS21_006374 [Conoideocrella luteorostrata]|uniref:Uncharacterized protein n=1 Tax=Conoideocrella luteorostrata TaxID=1105319 RepID=A0AAJ0FSY7_9HYPO|nr:hypothetical protein QQS21_006374 [Conoideocrella luteorostrata]